MVLSIIVGSVGTGLLSTIGLDTSTVHWATYMVLTGLGIGIGVQMPYTAVQAVSRWAKCGSDEREAVLTCVAAKQMRLLPTVSLYHTDARYR